MHEIHFNNDPSALPEFDQNCYPVQIFGGHKYDSSKASLAARSLIDSVRDLGISIDEKAIDLVTIAAAVTSAETFILRKDAADAWARQLHLHIPVYDVPLWSSLSVELASILGYLTGDMWRLTFFDSQVSLPTPKRSKKAKSKARTLIGLNCVCLFSGGLDSAVGAVDLVNGISQDAPLLVSHSYKGDGAKQRDIKQLLAGNFGELSYGIFPRIIKFLKGKTDVSMRGRSFNFIAMAVLGITALREANMDCSIKKIYIPENGYISLNPPLTRRRIGSHSTRTTHPYFLTKLENLLNKAGFNIEFCNPYQFKTKGEMISECVDQQSIEKIIPLSVSCSNWHRKHIQCGRCVPCIIRRASVFKSGFLVDAPYHNKNLATVKQYKDERDDLQALGAAIIRLEKTKKYQSWVRSSGTLPQDPLTRDDLYDVARRGLAEFEIFLKSEKVI